MEGKLEPWKGNGSPIWASKATMGCGAKRTREASKARSNPQHEERAAGWLACLTPELASHHGSSYGLLLGPGPQEGTCPFFPRSASIQCRT